MQNPPHTQADDGLAASHLNEIINSRHPTRMLLSRKHRRPCGSRFSSAQRLQLAGSGSLEPAPRLDPGGRPLV